MTSDFRIAATLLFTLVACCALAGCGGSASSPQPGPSVEVPAKPAPTWLEKDIEHEGATISLGYRGQIGKDRSVQPVAAIRQDGKPVAGAMVFCMLVAEEGEPIGQEMPTFYEPEAGGEALYIAPELQLPESGTQYIVRFRIVLPDAEQDLTREMQISAESL
jgi:hypothetical protein